MLKYLKAYIAFWFCMPLKMALDLTMVMHEMWDVQMGGNINSTGISRLKILNVLASSTKSDYQKIYFGYLVLNKLGVSFFRIDKNPQLPTTNNLWNERTINFYLPLLVLFCCQWLHHLPQMHWKKLEYFIKLF